MNFSSFRNYISGLPVKNNGYWSIYPTLQTSTPIQYISDSYIQCIVITQSPAFIYKKKKTTKNHQSCTLQYHRWH
ncbi:Uncharacterized protein TCM_037778 [Theobroma cacao]|uniref:Uncharacterized protein n=1 Tax=Theobroma cacao TaxID=3641 RepID=A0A061GNC8_THECC|nr:Uncharacterized protein TCM_037778 [Theobroma cacao]